MEELPEHMSVADVAAYLGLPRQTVYGRIYRDEPMPVGRFKIGNAWRFPRQSVLDFVEGLKAAEQRRVDERRREVA